MVRGFPKSMNIGLAIDKKNKIKSEVVGIGKSGAKETHTNSLNLVNNPFGGEYEIKKAQNQWNGWGTALKPSFEPIIVARKPLDGTCVDNVIKWGVGGINIDECRVGDEKLVNKGMSSLGVMHDDNWKSDKNVISEVSGRFPANTILTYEDEDFDEVCGGFPNTKSIRSNRGGSHNSKNDVYGGFLKHDDFNGYECGYNDSGSACRYYYCAKASKKDRDEGLEQFELKTKVFNGKSDKSSINIKDVEERFTTQGKNIHPTVKPTSLMQYLIRLVTPKGGTVLDPFMGSGSTGKAVAYENKEREANYKFVGIEMEQQYCDIAKARIEFADKSE